MKVSPLRLAIASLILWGYAMVANATPAFISFSKEDSVMRLYGLGLYPSILFSDNTDQGIKRAINDLKSDFEKVTGVSPKLANQAGDTKTPLIIVGTIGSNSIIDELAKNRKMDISPLYNKLEKYLIQTIPNPMEGIDEALVIAGSDKRGTIYGIYELSAQIGVSPWYYWADVPVKKQENLFVRKGVYTDGEPMVKYRGIFLNDEAPALSGWSKETFGGFNSKFYEKVFELILRLKGNFLWPAMWGSAFYDDDPQNGPLAHEMGIVISTSHHEPMGRAHDEWRRYGEGPWDYAKNPKALQAFWKTGMERMNDFEKVVTLGMRGDGDEPMSEGANISLLEKIVKDQRKIIADVTKKKLPETPQVWALYKEVQDYYDKGMRVPDDVTLLFCDDNWGNVRKLPELNAKPHKGGYGMYYHFDYVGGPRNSKWINISPVSRIWEQMNLTYHYGVKEIWVVNVGDLKPMEYPIQFFLDMAWNPERFNENNLEEHTENFCARQFGTEYAKEAARLINTYSKYNRRVTPELLNSKTYSLHNYNEFERVRDEYKELLLDAMKLNYLLPQESRDAYDQLVLYPIQACANLYEMYYAVAKNHDLAEKNDPEANFWADKAKAYFNRDSLLTHHYHTAIADGKWNHMMSQTCIGYTTWQQPPYNIMPEVKYLPTNESSAGTPVFVENDGYVSIEAPDYSNAGKSNSANWIIIPDLGKTSGAVTTSPVSRIPDENTWLEYDINFTSAGSVEIELLLSPTLNFNANRGLRYAISLAGGEEQIVNFNGHYRGELGRWQAEHIIRSKTTHNIPEKGIQTLYLRALDPGIVLQKIIVNTGGVKPSYLGPPESEKRHKSY